MRSKSMRQILRLFLWLPTSVCIEPMMPEIHGHYLIPVCLMFSSKIWRCTHHRDYYEQAHKLAAFGRFRLMKQLCLRLTSICAITLSTQVGYHLLRLVQMILLSSERRPFGGNLSISKLIPCRCEHPHSMKLTSKCLAM